MPDPEVVRVMRAHKAALLRGERAQMQEMARRWLGVERRLMGQMDALAQSMTQIKAGGGVVSAELLMNDVRYRTLLVQLTQELERYTGYADRTISARQGQLGRLGIRHSTGAIAAQGIQGTFSRLPIEAVEAIVGVSGDGAPLRNLLVASWPEAAEGLTQALVDGVALGHNPRKVAKEMARGATGSLQRMMVVARTEQLRVYRQASLDNYRASGVVEGYKRLCSHDSRVCPACLSDEGTFYSLDEQMPEHPQGRCVAIPVVEGVPQPRWVGGEDWFVEQSPARQESILGKGRYAAWLEGAFAFNEMARVVSNATWGPSLQVVPLGELVSAGQAQGVL